MKPKSHKKPAPKMKAFAWRSGLIEFARKMPSGALPIISTDGVSFTRQKIEPLARRAYDGKSLLVPGVPEAADDQAAMDAFEKFIGWLREREAP